MSTADRLHCHLDHIEARLDCIGGIFAGMREHNHWPIDPLEYAAVATRLERAAAIARQHIEAYERRDEMKAEADARVEAMFPTRRAA